MVAYWAWLGGKLGLTFGGRAVFTSVAILGLVGVVGDDLTGGVDGPNAAAILGVFALLALLCVIALDGAFRLARQALRSLG